jgi:zinc transport system substrate-binding protein
MNLSYRKKLAVIAAVMALLVAGAVVITALTGARQKEEKKINIVASFMPVYTAALQLTQGVDGADVTVLAPAKTGCLHDYQLTPDNMVALSKSDVLVINGAGAESFLSDALANYPDLSVIDTSKGVALIESGSPHEHGHLHEDEHSHNEHIWVNPSNHIRQVQNLRDGLIRYDSENKEKYQSNADEYISKIQSVKSELERAVLTLPTRNCILFHDSLAYFAQEFGLHPLASFSIGEETTLSAAQLAEAAQAAEKAGSVLLLYDSQYEAEYSSVAEKASYSLTLKLDTAVIGESEDPKDGWLNAMNKNLRMIKDAANPSY